MEAFNDFLLGFVTSSAPRASRSTTYKGHVLRPAQGISKKGRELININGKK
jgi:hypothetical protein